MKRFLLIILLSHFTWSYGLGQVPWPKASLAEAALDSTILHASLNQFPDFREHGVYSWLILKEGKLVWETYFGPQDGMQKHDLRSATKSITALLVGIALEKGILQSVEDPIRTYLAPTYHVPPAFDSVTIHHLLSMTAGLDCDDGDRSTKGQEDRMYRKKDWTQYFLNLSRTWPVGDSLRYCTGGVVALGEILRLASGREVSALAEEWLFAPLGITDYRWSRYDRDRKIDTGGHLYLRPIDLAKLGQLVLQEGVWQDQRLVSAAWVKRCLAWMHTWPNGVGYGYLWRTTDLPHPSGKVRVHYAQGNGGQVCFVVPEADMVVVFTGKNYNSPKASIPYQIFQHAVLPAWKSP
ncbi:MAG: serine hydrolase [Bacteroidota bacterium]